MTPTTVTIKVPASTSNLGSGFDTLGLAVQLYNHLRLSRTARPGLTLDWHLSDQDRSWFAAALGKAANLFFRKARCKRFGVEIGLSGNVPVARGLGASSTVRVGFLAGLNVLAGTNLSREQLLEMATLLEGHPDNASPAIFGGFTVSGRIGREVRCHSFPINAKLKCVTLIPPFGISTDEARKLIPATYAKADTAHALNRAALITAALAGGNYERLRGTFDDRMHQPYREKLIPRLSRVIRAGEKAGALGGFLSGSGSAIICLTVDSPEAVAIAMQKQFPKSEVITLIPDNCGFQMASVR
jgi:homoserine kinase